MALKNHKINFLSPISYRSYKYTAVQQITYKFAYINFTLKYELVYSDTADDY